MNRLSTTDRARVVAALVEGNSIRSTVRMTGIAKNTITKLLVDLGVACSAFLSEALVNLKCRRIQCDEVWSFVYAKDANLPESKLNEIGVGSVWTWTALCADCKLIASWLIGGRDAGTAHEFIHDLAGRLAHRVQLTTDGHKVYIDAVEDAFGADVDYGMLVKVYGESSEGERRYSPAICTGAQKKTIQGRPDPRHISTSFVERSNLTLRMGQRRFTRLTNAFSKKIENHMAAVALFVMHYNFARVHQTLRVTPAMEAGITDHVWTIEEIVSLID